MLRAADGYASQPVTSTITFQWIDELDFLGAF
jgi:hypothetical protein